MYGYEGRTQSSVLINQVSLFQGGPLRDVPLYTETMCTSALCDNCNVSYTVGDCVSTEKGGLIPRPEL